MHLKRRLRCVVFLYSSRPEPANASARCLENHFTLRHSAETPSSMYCVVIFHYANDSERQRAMIGKPYHILACAWEEIFDVMCVYNHAHQSQRTPARDDWKNTSHPDMHLERRRQRIVLLHSNRPKTVNASARWMETRIASCYALETTSSMYCVLFTFRPVTSISA